MANRTKARRTSKPVDTRRRFVDTRPEKRDEPGYSGDQDVFVLQEEL